MWLFLGRLCAMSLFNPTFPVYLLSMTASAMFVVMIILGSMEVPRPWLHLGVRLVASLQNDDTIEMEQGQEEPHIYTKLLKRFSGIS